MITEKDLPNRKTIEFLNARNNFFGHKKSNYIFENASLKTTKDISLFFDESQNIIKETLDEHIFWRPTHFYRFWQNKELVKDEIKKRLSYFESIEFKTTKNITVDQAIDLTHSFEHYVYGHLFDSLQRLYAIKEIAKETDTKFLVSNYSKITSFLEHLSILSGREIQEQDLILTKNEQEIKIKKLFYCTQTTVPAEISKDCYIWIFNKYYEHFGITDVKPKYNLYLNRNHIKINSRGVINNEEVIEYLRKNDFIILNGNEPLKEMIYYFANAKNVIGAHGSLFVNTTFCNNKAKILEFCPHNRICKNFLNQFKIAQNFIQIIVEGDENYNIKINLSDLGI